MFTLSGRRAIVTGGGSGIGAAIAYALAEAGAHTVVVGRRDSPLKEVQNKIIASGGAASAQTCDVTNRAAFAALLSANTPFHILVNNAGIAKHQPFSDITEEAFDDVFAVNIRSALFCTRDAANAFIAAGIHGAIINISSQMGQVGGKKRGVYCAAKHAVEGMTKAAALDLAPHRIRINTVCPTFVHTDLTDKALDDPCFAQDVLHSIPLGRLASPEDVAGAVVFLASDAAAMITGSAIMVDGGWTAR